MPMKLPTWPQVLFLVVFICLPALAYLTAIVYTIVTLGGLP